MKPLFYLLTLLFTTFLSWSVAQEIQVEVSYDTVYAGNYVAVEYSMQNWQGNLMAADFGDFRLIRGPQTRSEMTMRGSQRRSSRSVLFVLNPPNEPGEYIIPAQTFEGEGEKVTSKEVRITVIPNPDGVRQTPEIKQKGPSLMDMPQKYDKQYKRGEPQRGKRQRF